MKLYRGYKKEHFENVKNDLSNERSFEYISNFDDLVYKSNVWSGNNVGRFGDVFDNYEVDSEIFQQYINDVLGLSYEVIDDKLVAFGVNCCTDIKNVTQFNASPDADIIIEFEGNILSENIGGDGYIAKISKVLNIIEL